MPDSPLYIGLDAGGSKTELYACLDGEHTEAYVHQGPAAHLQHVGPQETARILAGLIADARDHFGDAPLAGVCAGVAGAGNEPDRAALQAALTDILRRDPPATLDVTHDANVALEGAFLGETGILVISGTGSIALARTLSGETLRAGGWGYLVGDEGSGHRIGLCGLHAVADAFDGGPATQLRERLAEALDITKPDDLIGYVYRNRLPVQHAAPHVVAAAADGDEVAAAILDEQTALLARQVGWLAARCEGIERRIALVGGLTNADHFRARLEAALGDVLPGWSVGPPRHRPAAGAWYRARRVHGRVA